MTVQSRECPHCAASLPPATGRCAYCGSWISEAPTSLSAKPAMTMAAGESRGHTWRLPHSAGEFGLRGWFPFVTALAGAAILYALGWRFEDSRYWLDERAALIWAGALPTWLLVAALLWQPKRLGWLAGFAIALTIFLVHLAVMYAIRRRINDDQAGIAALYAGASLLGWLLGRALHHVVRRFRARSGADSA